MYKGKGRNPGVWGMTPKTGKRWKKVRRWLRLRILLPGVLNTLFTASKKDLQRWSEGNLGRQPPVATGMYIQGKTGICRRCSCSCLQKAFWNQELNSRKSRGQGHILMRGRVSPHGSSKRLAGEDGDSLLQTACGNDLSLSCHPQKRVQLTQMHPSLGASFGCYLRVSLTICTHPVANVLPSPVTCWVEGKEWPWNGGRPLCSRFLKFQAVPPKTWTDLSDSFCFKIISKKTF